MTRYILVCIAVSIFTPLMHSQSVQPLDTLMSSATEFSRNSCLDSTKQDYQKSIVYFTEAIEADTNNLRAYYKLGMSYYKLSNYKKAIAIFGQVIHRDSCYDYAMNNRALCKFFLKDMEGACNDLKKALRCNYPDITSTQEDFEKICK